MAGSQPLTKREITEVEAKVDDLLTRTLIQVGDIRTMEERLAEIANRAAMVTRSNAPGRLREE